MSGSIVSFFQNEKITLLKEVIEEIFVPTRFPVVPKLIKLPCLGEILSYSISTGLSVKLASHRIA